MEAKQRTKYPVTSNGAAVGQGTTRNDLCGQALKHNHNRTHHFRVGEAPQGHAKGPLPNVWASRVLWMDRKY